MTESSHYIPIVYLSLIKFIAVKNFSMGLEALFFLLKTSYFYSLSWSFIFSIRIKKKGEKGKMQFNRREGIYDVWSGALLMPWWWKKNEISHVCTVHVYCSRRDDDDGESTGERTWLIHLFSFFSFLLGPATSYSLLLIRTTPLKSLKVRHSKGISSFARANSFSLFFLNYQLISTDTRNNLQAISKERV